MKVLFLGDSITDAGRNVQSGSLSSIGQGYVLLATAKLAVKYPGKFEFLNFGISGNRIVDIFSRIKKDCWNHQPDVISILAGVNDVWHEIDFNNGVDVDRFYRVYRMLIEDTLRELPNVKILLMEPFVLRGGSTEGNWELFRKEVKLRSEAVERLSKEFNLIYLPLQQMLDEACKDCPASYWLGDGVHPTPAGHQLIADAWLNLFEAKIMKV